MMVERKLFKTRLCVLYRKGYCHRQTCSFAHGDAELRRYTSSSSFNGRRDYRGGDLRDKLGRQRSPPRRNSFDIDARDRIPSRGDSSPRSGKRSNWSNRKRQRFDGESDFSGSLRRTSDEAEHQVKDRRPSSLEFEDVNDDQLKQVQSEIEMLEDHKQQLEGYLEEKAQEADSLISKIKELEMQLSTEKEENKRISSKIRKFVKANNRHSRIQDELKRSQVRLQRLGDQLGSDIQAVANEEDVSINILSDEETLGNHLMSPQHEQHKASPSKKRLRVHMMEADEESKPASFAREGLSTGNMRSERHSRWAQLNNRREMRIEANESNNGRPSEDRPTRGKSDFTSIPSADKLKDEVVEVVKSDEQFEGEEIALTRVKKGSALEDRGLPFPLPPPPPPPVPGKVYLQYKGKDENVEVDGLDDEMVDVDII